MHAVFRTYRLPLFATLLMGIGLSLWSWYRWHEINRTFDYFERQHALDTLNTIESVLKAFDWDDQRIPERVAGVVERIVRNSPVDFILLEQDAARIYQIGSPPDPLPLAEESKLADERLVLRRIIPFEPRDRLSTHVSKDRASVLAIGFKSRKKHPGYAGWIKNLQMTVLLGILLISASCIAWIMNIRSTLLSEQLKIERTRREHLEDLGLAAAGLAHETKNPLGIILGIAQRIAASPDTSPENLLLLERIIDAVDKASARLGNFITYAKPQKIHLCAMDLAQAVSKTVAILQPDYDLAGVCLVLACPAFQVLGDAERVQQVLVNLLLNSLHAASNGQRVTIRAVSKPDGVTLTVTDQGAGIPSDLLPHVFKPYVTGRPEGHGLGLSIVKRIVEDHGWRIAVTSTPGFGTTVTISGIRRVQGGK